jgi:hypothetical protein
MQPLTGHARLSTTLFRSPDGGFGLIFFGVVEKVSTLATFENVTLNQPRANNQGK